MEDSPCHQEMVELAAVGTYELQFTPGQLANSTLGNIGDLTLIQVGD